MPQDITPSGYLRAATAAVAGRSREAVELAVEGYRNEPTWPPNRQFARVFAERGAVPSLVEALAQAHFTDHIEATRELQLDLHREGLFADAITVGKASLEAEASPWVAYNLACSAARTGDREAAIAALQEAVTLGFDDRSLATSDDDLADLRDHQRWSAIVNAMG